MHKLVKLQDLKFVIAVENNKELLNSLCSKYYITLKICYECASRWSWLTICWWAGVFTDQDTGFGHPGMYPKNPVGFFG